MTTTAHATAAPETSLPRRGARREPARGRRSGRPPHGAAGGRPVRGHHLTGLIPAQARATAVLDARVPGVLSGGEVFAAAMKLTDPGAVVELLVNDGEAFAAGTALARVTGNARAVLLAERVA